MKMLTRQFNCNADIKDVQGVTPKSLAMITGHFNIVKFLNGEDVDEDHEPHKVSVE